MLKYGRLNAFIKLSKFLLLSRTFALNGSVSFIARHFTWSSPNDSFKEHNVPCLTPTPSPTAVTYCEFFAFSKRPPAPHTLLLEYGELALLTCIFKFGELAGFGRLGCSGETIEVHFQGACEEKPVTVMEALLKSINILIHPYIPPSLPSSLPASIHSLVIQSAYWVTSMCQVLGVQIWPRHVWCPQSINNVVAGRKQEQSHNMLTCKPRFSVPFIALGIFPAPWMRSGSRACPLSLPLP